ncbi:FYVE zinc finger [Venustampulla echinocandica]|uniref:FYVE zinc finger n=1 Tax=Venustampulla echinocandica TaxID=2656787 RepID=A0A370TZ85_9HELO|nr:FYVE zinc finger [Venustampulla echinocandica]RDL40832.1 FYVE zinc finger [Venustampulla echinocandica]
MDTARRSSRASRPSQPLQSTSHHSSASSNSSSRADRATRSNHKTESPRKLTPSGSPSSEPPDDAIANPAEDAIQTRRKRSRGEEREKPSKPQTAQTEITNGIDENADDDEAVRCICGFDEYPGPPQLGEEDSKHGIKDGIEEPIITVADVTEDGAGFFLQCDVCKVWQHGYCVGIMNEDMSPDEYFCELCRPDLHKIFAAPNGQRYSHYLPLYQSLSQTTSRAASFSKDGTRSPRGSKSGRPSSSLQSAAKRRSTMNSRDAAYDEEEQLRRAIEASKGGKSGESTDGGTEIRRSKRERSDSEEKHEGIKRQRTLSASPSPSRELQQTPLADSDDGTNGRQTGARKIRGAAARNHREKEMREERERTRQEAANKRKGRAERRRVDDSDPSEELPLAARSVSNRVTEAAAQPLDPPTSPQVATPDTPPPNLPQVRKGGRPPNSRKGKLGKNQYTKDRDLQDGDDQSPHRSQSRDIGRGDDSGHGPGNKGPNEGKSGKSRNSGSKITMGDMRKRVATILDFISRTQLEMAGESMSRDSADAAERTIRGIADGLPMIKVNGKKGQESEGGQAEEGSNKDFKDLTCLEMMDVLTRQLVKWQHEFV